MQSAVAQRVGGGVFGCGAAPCRPVAASRGALQVVNGWGRLPKIGGGRKWEHLEVNQNGKVERLKLHVKKGDFVQVIAGKDKGKTGTITKVVPKLGMVFVEGVNIKTKNMAPRAENEKGQQKQLEFPIDHSNVQHYSKEKQVRSRVGYKFNAEGKKVRYLIKTGEEV
ncbi:KOW domain-containing protein [Haematococcus lacustris]|uniref:KOW domain-containing protein n=1 Tax=Haematococcus lacustris TaxID=44745 RepID=A0A699Z2E3_HAELA|nr:KOW domain-containing protein [Haematococcus lacustris]